MNDERVLAAVESKRAAALATHRFVHHAPGLSHAERECTREIAAVLEAGGSRSSEASPAWRLRSRRR